MILRKLTGSPRQIKWAVNIRVERLRTWKEQSPELFKKLESELARMTSSGWWIDYREKDLWTVEKHLQYGVNLKKKPSKQAVTKKTEGGSSLNKGCIKENTSTSRLSGFRLEGAVRDVNTGEVVEDDSIPF